MAVDVLSCEYGEDEYIDMEVSSYSKTSPPQPREFEFQMLTSCRERENISPADELFYKGNLLPLHLPPRLKMVEKLIQSCNISPSESCRMSGNINPDEYFLEEGRRSFDNGNSKKSWTKKLKHSSIGMKLKASRAYFKSWFSKSDRSDERADSKDQGLAKKNPFGEIQKNPSSVQSFKKEKNSDSIDESSCPRSSFSITFKRHLTANCSSSSGFCSSSNYEHNSNGFNKLKLIKRCGSVHSEFESSIQGAIAHCKQSQQLFCSRKTVSEVAFLHPFSASRINVCETQEKPELSRG